MNCFVIDCTLTHDNMTGYGMIIQPASLTGNSFENNVTYGMTHQRVDGNNLVFMNSRYVSREMYKEWQNRHNPFCMVVRKY